MSLLNGRCDGERVWRLLLECDDVAVGAHLVTPRRGYWHHGIYVGAGRVVHYSAQAFSLIRHPVEEVSLARFARHHPVWIEAREVGSYDAQEIIRRARSRLGENRYRLFTNNCEHFCEWCIRGEARSAQVDALLAMVAVPTRLADALTGRLRGWASGWSIRASFRTASD